KAHDVGTSERPLPSDTPLQRRPKWGVTLPASNEPTMRTVSRFQIIVLYPTCARSSSIPETAESARAGAPRAEGTEVPAHPAAASASSARGPSIAPAAAGERSERKPGRTWRAAAGAAFIRK